ncbi:uncharacterized protein LOC129748134 [Uranotaenia lowii]|uniref:uncharacterized protein LOC129748134 n=1 Tax=Uranotaenia lowii TaxID=190385 RepID=UPI002479E4CA|nr:uncharacterized protein LOC129748134 [Uranotaenia lowii]
MQQQMQSLPLEVNSAGSRQKIRSSMLPCCEVISTANIPGSHLKRRCLNTEGERYVNTRHAFAEDQVVFEAVQTVLKSGKVRTENLSGQSTTNDFTQAKDSFPEYFFFFVRQPNATLKFKMYSICIASSMLLILTNN